LTGSTAITIDADTVIAVSSGAATATTSVFTTKAAVKLPAVVTTVVAASASQGNVCIAAYLSVALVVTMFVASSVSVTLLGS
jgi:hypothetical protein